MLLSCSAPTEVENAVDEANLDCPVNLVVAQLESVEIDDGDIVCTITCGQIQRNIVLSAPDQFKYSIIAILKTMVGQSFNTLTKVAEEYNYNIVLRIEDDKDSFDPYDITVTPEEIAKVDTRDIQVSLPNIPGLF